jgi:hypothetical protein
MKFFPFSKYPHLNEVFDHGYCDDGSHVKDEVFACHFPAKGVLAEETSKDWQSSTTTETQDSAPATG